MNERDAAATEAHALFERVIDLDHDARVAVLDEVCAGRPRLRRLIEELLALDASAESLLDGDPEDLLSLLLDDDEVADRTVGPYRIVRELGRGGMGAVYLAERADGEFEKRVALKLVKRGMDTDEILSRFRQERRILASLEHPNIARLYDGGVSEDGRPYLVMELVEGETITSYCDRLHLTIDQRLGLFHTICAAVQHAHQNLVVHRDLKPSNVVVAADGTPRLLDFGIAKLLADDNVSSPRTRTGVQVLTPEYAAPEQLRGDTVTTATDVYALGALLYELLTGRRPFERHRTDLPSAAPRHADRPSAVAGHPVDAADARARPAAATPDDIARARATTPDRLRRRLAGDLDTITLHALDSDPGVRYGSAQQLLDDLERHRSGLPIQARPPALVYRAAKFARRHRSALAAAAIILITLVGGMGATLWQARRAAVERDAAEGARRRSDQVAAFLLNIFDSADPLGIRPERTDTVRVRDMVDRGANRVRTELKGQPDLQAEMLTLLGRVYANLGAFDKAEESLRDALAFPAPQGLVHRRAVPLSLLAGVATMQGEFTRADSLLDRVLTIYGETRSDPDSLYAATLSDRGLALMHLGEYGESRRLHESALELIRQMGLEGRPLHGRALGNLATLHYDMGDYAEAENVFRETIAIQERYLSPGHPRFAATLNNLASSAQYQGKLAEAEPLYVEAIAIARGALGDTHSEVGNYLQNLATLYDDQGRLTEAEHLYRESIHAHEVSLGRTNVNTALVIRNFALNRYAVGELGEAETLLREAHVSIAAGLGPDHLYTAVAAAALGRVLTATGKLDEALPYIMQGLDGLAEQLPSDHHLVVVSRRDLGAYHSARGDFETAEPLLQSSHTALAADRGPDHYLTREARRQLHDMYIAWERPEQAEEFR